MLPPVVCHVTGIVPVSPAEVNPTAVNAEVWLALSAICAGETAIRVTTSPGPASRAGFSQAISVANTTNRRLSFSSAIRAESLCLKAISQFLRGAQKTPGRRFRLESKRWRPGERGEGIRGSPVTLRHRLSTGLL